MATETEQSIEDLKLSTTFHNNLTIHSRSGTHEQLWARVKMIGAGAFGDVWLEQKVRADHTAELGEAEAEVERVPDVDLRAVKRIRYTGQNLDWSRELKILAQLKNVRVHMLCLCLGDSGEKEGEGAKGRYC
jgi:serine/threonine protein kinase